MRGFLVFAVLLLTASAIRADGTPPTPLHQPPAQPEIALPPPALLSPWDEVLIVPREPLPVQMFVATPEPASVALLGVGLLALGLVWRR